MLSGAYRGLQDSGAVVMEALLLEKIASVRPCSHCHPVPPMPPPQASYYVRWAAARYASVVFPFSHTLSRFVCIVAVGDRCACRSSVAIIN